MVPDDGTRTWPSTTRSRMLLGLIAAGIPRNLRVDTVTAMWATIDTQHDARDAGPVQSSARCCVSGSKRPTSAPAARGSRPTDGTRRLQSDYDWREAFGYARQPGTCAMGHASVYYIDNGPGVVPGGRGHGKHPGFQAMRSGDHRGFPGENDGPGGSASCASGSPQLQPCAYRPGLTSTFPQGRVRLRGWACQAGGCAYCRDLAQLVRWGIGTEDLRRLEDTGWLPPG